MRSPMKLVVPAAGLAWLSLAAPAHASAEEALMMALAFAPLAFFGVFVLAMLAAPFVVIRALLRGKAVPPAPVVMGLRPTGEPDGGAVARDARAPAAPRWHDPSLDVLERLLEGRDPDSFPVEADPGRAFTLDELAARHPRFHPAYVRARVEAIFPRIQRAWADDDLAAAADCLAGPGRQELQIRIDEARRAGGDPVAADARLTAVTPVTVRDRLADDRDTLYVEVAGRLTDELAFREVWRLAWQPQGWVLAGFHTDAAHAEVLAERNVAPPDVDPAGGAVGRQDA